MTDEIKRLYIYLLSDKSVKFRVIDTKESWHKVALMRASELTVKSTDPNINGDTFRIDGDIYATFPCYRVELEEKPRYGSTAHVGNWIRKSITLVPNIDYFRRYLPGKGSWTS